MLLPNGIFLCELLLRFVSYCKKQYIGLGLGLGCLTPFSTMFYLYRGGQFYWWREQDKTTDLPQVTDKH